MLTDTAIKLIQDTAIKSSGAHAAIFTVPTEPPGTYFVRNEAGEIERFDATPQFAARAGNVPTAVKWAEDEAVVHGKHVEIWYDRTEVQAIAFGQPDHTCTFALARSEPLAELARWAALPKGFEVDHQSLFRLFRTTMYDAMSQHPDILDIIKKVDIKKAQDVAGEVARKGVSMSRSMLAEATGADKLPPILTFEVPVFATPTVPVKARVRVSFDLDAQSERFRLTVLPGEIENAEVEGEAAIYRQILVAMPKQDGAAAISVYYGKV